MRFLNLNDDPTIPAVLDLLRTLTRADNSQDAMSEFAARFSRVRPVDYYIGVLPERNGRYRIHYRISPHAPGGQRRDVRPEVVSGLPVHEGGFVAQMIADGGPKMALELDLSADPVIGAEVKGMPSCMALPIFEGDAISEWNLTFSRRSAGFEPANVAQAVMTSNLLGIANRQLDTVSEVKRLNRAMLGQLDQIARLQQALLPERIPEIPGLEIATSYLTSDQAGGDYYDFFPLPDGRWGILIADVSGHGAAAATVMAMLHAIVHSYRSMARGDDPAAVLKFANERLVASGVDGSFVTAFLAVYDPFTGRLVYSNSGHNPPRRKNGNTGRITAMDEAASLPLGILDPLDAQRVTVDLNINDTVVLYTDGITEAFDDDRKMFGVERLDAALTGCTGQPDCVVESVHKALFAHRRKATRDDDQTLVAFRFHGICRI